MKKKGWPVLQEQIRPAGPQDACYYCAQKIGRQHAADCVMRTRTVLLKATVEIVVRVPEVWDEETVLFHRNQGSWCADNFTAELEALAEAKGCLCGLVGFEFVREATAADEKTKGF